MAETMEQEKAHAAVWGAGAGERLRQAVANIFSSCSPQPCAAIDVNSRVYPEVIWWHGNPIFPFPCNAE